MSTPVPGAARPVAADPVAAEAQRLAATVLTCPLVAGLHGGPHGTVATYSPAGVVTGLRLTDAAPAPDATATTAAAASATAGPAHEPGGRWLVEVGVVAIFGASLARVGEQVRAAVRALLPGAEVAVVIGDVAAPHP